MNREKHLSKKLSGTVAVIDAYAVFLGELKSRIAAVQTRAHLAVSREVILFYWQTGRDIVLRQQHEGWGKSVIERLAADIQSAFPGIEGFSPLNVWRMRAFYLAYHEGVVILSQPATELKVVTRQGDSLPVLAQVAQELPPSEVLAIPWYHNVILIQKVKDPVLGLSAKNRLIV